MSAIFRPVVIDPCQTGLRGRRRSSVYPLNAVVPRILTTTARASDDNAVSDEPTVSEPREAKLPGAATQNLQLSLPLNAHLPDVASRVTIPRHSESPTTVSLYEPTTPTTPSPITPSLSRKNSLAVLIPNPVYTEKRKPERLRWRLAAGFFAYFLCGWGDGVTATVIPYFMKDFHLSSMTLSLLFAGSTCGFGIGTIVVERILNFLGQFNYKQPRNTLLPASPLLAKLRGKILSKEDIGSSVSQARFLVLIIGCVLHSTHFVLMGIRKGFGSMFLAYAIAAFARALWTASLNAYFALGPKQSLGYSYGLWSFGGVVSPLICQAITSKKVPWSHFYFGSLVLSVFNLAFLVLTFRPTDTELNHERREAAAKTTKPLTEDYFSAISSTVEDPFAPSSPTSTERSPNNSTLRLAIAMPLVWALSICSMLYSGTETTTVGFMVTFLLQARHADPNGAGYVTSGFWGGITVGRFIWGSLTPRLTYTQRKILVQVTLAVALTMHLLIWFTKSIFGNALCASIIGLLYGPVFPAFLSMATDILPTDVHLVSMAIISATSSIGSALLPFIAGTILGVKGAQTLTYFTVASGIVLTCLWAILPSRIPADQMRDKN